MGMLRCEKDWYLTVSLRTAAKRRSFASANFVNGRHSRWFFSQILLLILVIELNLKLVMKSDMFHCYQYFFSVSIVQFCLNGMQPYLW